MFNINTDAVHWDSQTWANQWPAIGNNSLNMAMLNVVTDDDRPQEEWHAVSPKESNKMTLKEFLPSHTEPTTHNMFAELADSEAASKPSEDEVEGQQLSIRQKKRNAATKQYSIAT